MDNDNIVKGLFSEEVVKKYGDKYIEHFLEQYKIYVEMLDKISDRRQQANEFFLTLNTALLGYLGYVESKDGFNLLLFLSAPIAGMCLSYFWFRIVKSYKDLNTGKFKVIHAIEQRLPIALFETEWLVVGKGKDPNLYVPFTHVEIKIPWIFFALYFIVLCWSIPWDQVHDFICNICY